MEKRYSVYKHTTPSNKVYIGITMQTPSRRWRKGWGYRNQRLFYNAIKSYGWDNIKHEILYKNVSENFALQKEIELIAEYKSNNIKYGYNISDGGDTRAEWAKTARGKNKNTIIVGYNNKKKYYFRSQTEAVYFGYSQSAINLCLNGKRNTHKGLHWRRLEENENPNFDMAKTVKRNPMNKNKPIIAINIKTNEIKEYRSTHEAEKDGFNRGNIKAVLNGRKLSHHGYKFMYKGG